MVIDFKRKILKSMEVSEVYMLVLLFITVWFCFYEKGWTDE